MQDSRKLASICCLVAALLSVPPAFAGGALDRLQVLEECLLGRSHRELPLEARLETLERRALGHSQTGPVANRLQALEKVVGRHSATLLPPVAPQLDNGSTAPLKVPSLSASTRALPPVASTPEAKAEAAIQADPNMPPVAPPRFNSPFATSQGNVTVLHAGATEYGAGQPMFVSPFTPYQGPPPNISAGATQVCQQPLQGQTNQASSISATSRSELGTAARMGLGAAMNATTRFGGAGFLGPLHCPICRMLGGL